MQNWTGLPPNLCDLQPSAAQVEATPSFQLFSPTTQKSSWVFLSLSLCISRLLNSWVGFPHNPNPSLLTTSIAAALLQVAFITAQGHRGGLLTWFPLTVRAGSSEKVVGVSVLCPVLSGSPDPCESASAFSGHVGPLLFLWHTRFTCAWIIWGSSTKKQTKTKKHHWYYIDLILNSYF